MERLLCSMPTTLYYAIPKITGPDVLQVQTRVPLSNIGLPELAVDLKDR